MFSGLQSHLIDHYCVIISIHVFCWFLWFRFGRTKSIQWLQSLFFSFLQCVFITHPILVCLTIMIVIVNSVIFIVVVVIVIHHFWEYNEYNTRNICFQCIDSKMIDVHIPLSVWYITHHTSHIYAKHVSLSTC